MKVFEHVIKLPATVEHRDIKLWSKAILLSNNILLPAVVCVLKDGREIITLIK